MREEELAVHAAVLDGSTTIDLGTEYELRIGRELVGRAVASRERALGRAVVHELHRVRTCRLHVLIATARLPALRHRTTFRRLWSKALNSTTHAQQTSARSGWPIATAEPFGYRVAPQVADCARLSEV